MTTIFEVRPSCTSEAMFSIYVRVRQRALSLAVDE